jgi:hypothetical protein
LGSPCPRIARSPSHVRRQRVSIGPSNQQIFDIGELVITVTFDVEIAICLIAHLSEWHGFFVQGTYLVFVLTIGSMVIQFPIVYHMLLFLAHHKLIVNKDALV